MGSLGSRMSKPKDRNTMNRNRLYLTAVFTGVLYIILVVNTPVVSGKEITKRTLNGQVGIINVNGVDSIPVSDEDKAPELPNEILQKETEAEEGKIDADPQVGDVLRVYRPYLYGKRADPMFNDFKQDGYGGNPHTKIAPGYGKRQAPQTNDLKENGYGKRQAPQTNDLKENGYGKRQVMTNDLKGNGYGKRQVMTNDLKENGYGKRQVMT